MSHYFTKCPDCGALLDPCEVCDCKKSAAPDAGTIENGKNVHKDIDIITQNIEKCNGDISTLLREGLATLPEDEQIQLLDWCVEKGIDLPLVRAYKMLYTLSDEQIEKLLEAFKETEVNA